MSKSASFYFALRYFRAQEILHKKISKNKKVEDQVTKIKNLTQKKKKAMQAAEEEND